MDFLAPIGLQFSEPLSLAVLQPILPELGLTLLALIVLGIDMVTPEERRGGIGVITAVGVGVILVVNLLVGGPTSDELSEQLVLGGMVRHDTLALIFKTMVLLAAGLTALVSVGLKRIGRQGEYYAIILVATLGMTLMSAAADLIMVFVALETTSIALYILAGILRDDDRSAEAGLKYFLFGAFTSSIMLYGLSLLFGFTGKTNLYELAEPLSEIFSSGAEGSFAVALSLVLILVGFGFKVAAVPFHFWTPDVYQGAPTPITGFISTASKAASFALLMRVFLAAFPGLESQWTALFAVMAAVTMTVGNVLALPQRNIKRLLAYSSIAQAGYVLIGVATVSDLGSAAVTFYLFMYVLTNIAAFAVVALFSEATGSEEIADLAGLSRRSPYVALAMVVALLSLAGIPPLAGFFGKFFLFLAAVEAGMVWLAIVGVLNAIVGLYYYLTVIKVMYVDRAEDESPIGVPMAQTVTLLVTSIGVVVMGTFSAPWFNWAVKAAAGLDVTVVLP